MHSENQPYSCSLTGSGVGEQQFRYRSSIPGTDVGVHLSRDQLKPSPKLPLFNPLLFSALIPLNQPTKPLTASAWRKRTLAAVNELCIQEATLH